jgi:DNA-binding CsgD family transcriptional regulator
MADEALSRALRRARDQFLSSRDIPSSVRADIAASWRRSALHGLAPDRLAALYDGDLVDLTGRFAVSARPVADRLGDDLADTGVTLLLADDQARLIDRRVSDAGLRARLDTSLVAPGFRCDEQHVGTNAIGTSLQQRSPAVVTGTEHFADTFSTLACAAAPVIDARSGQIVGAIGLTCPAEISSALMLPFVKRAAFAIEQRLVAGSATADHALLRRFLQARRRAKGPLVSVNQHVMHTNTAAARIVNPADQEILWTWARHAVAGQAQAESELYLASGLPVLARARPVHEGGVLAGALVRMEPQIPVVPPAVSPAGIPRQASGASRASGATLGWASLTQTERSVAEIIAEGATNRDAAARLFLSPHTIDYHLRQIFRKLTIGSRVELTRFVVQQAGSGSDEGLAADRQPASIRRPATGAARISPGGLRNGDRWPTVSRHENHDLPGADGTQRERARHHRAVRGVCPRVSSGRRRAPACLRPPRDSGHSADRAWRR